MLQIFLLIGFFASTLTAQASQPQTRNDLPPSVQVALQEVDELLSPFMRKPLVYFEPGADQDGYDPLPHLLKISTPIKAVIQHEYAHAYFRQNFTLQGETFSKRIQTSQFKLQLLLKIEKSRDERLKRGELTPALHERLKQLTTLQKQELIHNASRVPRFKMYDELWADFIPALLSKDPYAVIWGILESIPMREFPLLPTETYVYWLQRSFEADPDIILTQNTAMGDDDPYSLVNSVRYALWPLMQRAHSLDQKQLVALLLKKSIQHEIDRWMSEPDPTDKHSPEELTEGLLNELESISKMDFPAQFPQVVIQAHALPKHLTRRILNFHTPRFDSACSELLTGFEDTE